MPNIGQAALFIGRKAAQWAAFLRLTLPAYVGRKAACIRRQKRGRRARRWLARGISAYLRAVCRTVRRPFDVFEQIRTHAPGPLSDLYGLRRLRDGVMQPRHMRHGAALLFPQPKAALRQRRIRARLWSASGFIVFYILPFWRAHKADGRPPSVPKADAPAARRTRR